MDGNTENRNGFLRQCQKGTGMLEVLVAAIIFSIGLLGVVSMQSVAIRNSLGALEQTQSSVLTGAIIEAMRADVKTTQSGGYNLSRTCSSYSGDARTLAQSNLRYWLDSVRSSLGDQDTTCVAIVCASSQQEDGEPVANCTVSLEWKTVDEKQDGNDARSFRKVEIKAQIG